MRMRGSFIQRVKVGTSVSSGARKDSRSDSMKSVVVIALASELRFHSDGNFSLPGVPELWFLTGLSRQGGGKVGYASLPTRTLFDVGSFDAGADHFLRRRSGAVVQTERRRSEPAERLQAGFIYESGSEAAVHHQRRSRQRRSRALLQRSRSSGASAGHGRQADHPG